VGKVVDLRLQRVELPHDFKESWPPPRSKCPAEVSDPFKRRSARVVAKCVATAQSRVIGCRITGFQSRARLPDQIATFSSGC
jgi:hypothetical protein